MSQSESEDEKPLSPEQQRIVAKVRWLMLLSGFATLFGIAVIIGVIGYRVFRTDGSPGPSEVVAMLPKGAKIVTTAAVGEQIAVTIEIDGIIEIRTFDGRTLRPAGRLRFAVEP